MTMISFRVESSEADQAQRWANHLGVDKSELLRDALHRHLVRLAAEHDITSWGSQPLSPEENELGEIATWGPAEDWSDWANAEG